MTMIGYEFVSRCAGGCHYALNVTLNGNVIASPVYDIDQARAPLAQMTTEEREAAALAILRLHFAGFTRPQIVSAFQAAGGVVGVTI